MDKAQESLGVAALSELFSQFLICYMLRADLVRQFTWALKTNTKLMDNKNIQNFTLNFFLYLELCAKPDQSLLR